MTNHNLAFFVIPLVFAVACSSSDSGSSDGSGASTGVAGTGGAGVAGTVGSAGSTGVGGKGGGMGGKGGTAGIGGSGGSGGSSGSSGVGGTAGSSGVGGSAGSSGVGGGAGSAGAGGGGASFAAVQAVFAAHGCTGGFLPCHGTSPFDGALDLTAPNAYASLVSVPADIAPTKLRVKPGDAAGSFLMQKLTNNLAADMSEGSPMPQGEAIPWNAIKLPPSDLAVIAAWINAGAPQ